MGNSWSSKRPEADVYPVRKANSETGDMHRSRKSTTLANCPFSSMGVPSHNKTLHVPGGECGQRSSGRPSSSPAGFFSSRIVRPGRRSDPIAEMYEDGETQRRNVQSCDIFSVDKKVQPTNIRSSQINSQSSTDNSDNFRISTKREFCTEKAHDSMDNYQQNISKESVDTSPLEKNDKKKKKKKWKKKQFKDKFRNKSLNDQMAIPEEHTVNQETQTDANYTDESRSIKFAFDTMTSRLRNLENDCHDENKIVVGTVYKTSNDCEELIPAEFIASCARIEQCVNRLKTKVVSLKADNNKYLDRLSEAAGSKLSDNNPNIANLNDNDRPLKIAERYGSLYDNEWSDAYTELSIHRDEKIVIHHLCSLLKVSYFCCFRKAELQEAHMFTMSNNSKEQINEMWKAIPGEKEKFMSTRKRIAPVVIQYLQQTLTDDDVYKEELSKCEPALEDQILGVLYSPASRKFFDKCIEVCWYMTIQIPPLHLDTKSLNGTKLNKETHKEYTQSGTMVDFCVWPALYLTDDKENLLSKGTVQPYKSAPNDKWTAL